MPEVHIRKATAKDAEVVLSLVDGLAAYEKLDPPDAAAKQRLIHDLFGERPRLEAYLGACDGRAVGYAFVFETYSSFLALPRSISRTSSFFPNSGSGRSVIPSSPPWWKR